MKIPKLRFKDENGNDYPDWVGKNFQELVLLQRGSSPRPIANYITTSPDGVNWIKIGDTNKENRFITSTSQKITKEGAKKSREVKAGELILSNSMSFGRPFILKIDGCIHDGWFVLRNYEKNLNKEFLCQLLGSEIVQKQYEKLAAGGVVENISSELVYAVNIKLPCLEEQEKIANFLSSVDKKISITEEKLNLFKEYKKGIMQKIFKQEIRFKDSNGNDYPDWVEKELKEISELTSSKRIFLSEYTNTGVPFYRGKEITELRSGKKISESLYISLEKYNEILEKYGVPQKNDILITAVGTLGNLYLIENDDKFYFKDGNLIWLRNIKCLSKYLFHNLDYNKKQILDSSIGSTQKALTIVNLNKILIQVPCLEEQKKIADFLSSIDNKIENLSNELENLKDFKKGLLQKMFI